MSGGNAQTLKPGKVSGKIRSLRTVYGAARKNRVSIREGGTTPPSWRKVKGGEYLEKKRATVKAPSFGCLARRRRRKQGGGKEMLVLGFAMRQ